MVRFFTNSQDKAAAFDALIKECLAKRASANYTYINQRLNENHSDRVRTRIICHDLTVRVRFLTATVSVGIHTEMLFSIDNV